MSDVKTLYDEDLVAWSKQQAEALRAAEVGRSSRQLDWENLAEEIEDLGTSQTSALHSQIRRIIRHLLKLENSPATEPRRGWFESINGARAEIDYLLERSPSLRSELAASIAAETKRGTQLAISDLERYDEIDREAAARIRAATYTAEQILGDWFPPEP